MIFGSSRPRRPRPSRRASQRDHDGVPLPPRLIPSLRQLVSSAVSLGHTRIMLAGVELEEELQRFIRAAVLSFVAMLLGLMVIVVGTFTIVLAVPPDDRVGAMALITLIYLAGASIAVLKVRDIFRSRPPIFSATLAELEKDKETLSQMSRAHEAAERTRDHARRMEDGDGA